MTAIVSDSGPIHYLALCDVLNLVPSIFQKVIIPAAVRDELSHSSTPPAVSEWLTKLPEWIEVRPPKAALESNALGKGEREAIALAIEFQLPLITDDRLARKVALKSGLLVTGTLGIIEKMANNRLIVKREVLQKLLATNFRIDRKLLAELLNPL